MDSFKLKSSRNKWNRIFYLWAALLLCLVVSSANGYSVVDLGGNDWIVSQESGNLTVNAKVPGSIYTDLVRQGVLGDPLFRKNDLLYRWVSKSNWTYVRQFTVPPQLLQMDHVLLRCEGLDTVASVYVNHMHLANTDNMFRRYIFDVKKVLKEGVNTIQVHFQSPVEYTAKKAAAYPYDVPPDCPTPEQRGECHGNFIRKEACSFSWDWGPAFPTVGIWKDILVEGFNGPILRYAIPFTTKVGNDWQLTVRTHFEEVTGPTSGIVTVLVPELDISEQQAVMLDTDSPMTEIDITVPASKVSLWWPNGHGDPHLYSMTVSYSSNQESLQPKHILHFGFRTIKLIQDPVVGASGLAFHFEVNGQPVFMKGSNWIPADNFQERISEDYVDDLLQSAAEANMNMLRVWGGGIYESDAFYNAADRHGILLWQDFMFACADYPGDDDFLENVRKEVTHQVRKLGVHPSIAIWAGNNENEWGFMAKRHTPTDPSKLQYYKDYIALTVSTIFAVVNQEDPLSRPFVPSSPSNGLETITEGWVAKNPQDTHYGDVHHYDYKGDTWNPDVFPIPRFASEYGLQSWCSFETLRPISSPEDWRIDSQEQMWDEFTMHMKPPTSTNETQKFIDYIYLTQINQAVGIKTEAELYRRMQDHLNPSGEGLTMGSLYWQLNDIWQAPTWASIEYGGKWKMLHYFAKEFYAQTLISPALKEDKVQVFLIHEVPVSQKSNDLKFVPWRKLQNSLYRHPNEAVTMERTIQQVRSWRVYVMMYEWSQAQPLKTWTKTISQLNQTSNLIMEEDLSTMLSESGCPSVQHCFLYFTTSSSDGQYHSENWLLLSNFTDAIGLSVPKIKVDGFSMTDQGFRFTLTSDVIAPFVWLEVEGVKGHFSSNGFLLGVNSGAAKTVEFISKQKIGLSEFSKALCVKSLMNVYES